MILLWLALSLIGMLGHEEYDVREDAEVTLARLNKACDLQGLVSWAKDRHPDPEVRRRAKRVWSAYRDVSPESGYFPRVEFMKPRDYDEGYDRACSESDVGTQCYYRDPYYHDRPDRGALYLEDSKRRRAARAWAMTLMDRGASRAEIVAKLDEAVALEKKCGLVPAEEP